MRMIHTAPVVALGSVLGIALLVVPSTGVRGASRPRARIKGIAFVRVNVSDLAVSRRFYEQYFQLGNHFNQCLATNSVCFRLSSAQSIELVQAEVPPGGSFLAEVGFWTDDLEGLHHYLSAAGATVGDIFTGYDDRKIFELRDPENHRIAFVSDPLPGSFFTWSTQLSRQLLHAGFVANDMQAENHFYRDLLGFRLYWQGGFKDVDRSAVASDKDIDWYEIQVPDGHNWLEYMLNISASADHAELGVQNHFSLGVKDIQATADQLRKNGLTKFDGPEIGRDGKWALDVYDPDGTRIEFMEFTPAQKPCCHPYTAEHPTP
jgi:catechol 2,3-dioxygenase-like lactoylglutathione lyase family enzyme